MEIRLFSILTAVMMSSALYGQGQDGATYDPVVIDSREYQITCDWLNRSVFGDISMRNVCIDFFVYKDILYLSHTDTEEHKLHRVDALTGEFLGTVEIEWGGIPHSTAASNYVGQDDDGTPFVASFSDSSLPQYPYTIASLKIEEGIPKVESMFTLPDSEPGWVVGRTAVSGSLKDGRFRAVASIKFRNGNMRTPWGYAEWRYDKDGPIVSGSAKMDFQIGEAIPLADDMVIIYNCADNIDNTDGYDCTVPTLGRLTTDNLFEEIDVFRGQIDNQAACGLATVNYNGVDFMIYGSGYEPARYAVAQLTDFPQSLDSNHLWTLGQEISYSDKNETCTDQFSMKYPAQVVRCDRDTGDGLHFYLLTAHSGLARYTLREEMIQTGIGQTSAGHDVDIYFTPDGRRLPTQPQYPGLYLRMTSKGTEKIIIR